MFSTLTFPHGRHTRDPLAFADGAAMAYTGVFRFRPNFCPYEMAVVFANVRELRVVISIISLYRGSKRAPGGLVV